ncbi:hypothetical protein D8674_029108 [Pyrus ussuriensis x Pyrus communis]|uniref:Uncharacterized protein n=1 Tax=Pyrus ussuriensis x Pyrus communis TaxID=2448454 RepID=A0A5N5I2X0_9ROSA|nr:hypothetical protein D8674_029108 [Pyrus ussuriensis x Pyrus communis]
MEVSMVRLLSRRLWNRGATNFSCFKIPSRTMPMPHVKDWLCASKFGQLFPNLTLDRSTSVAEKCASFSANGTVSLSEMRLPGACLTTEQGHFSIAVPSKRKGGLKHLWVIGFVLGFPPIVLAGYVGIVSSMHLKTKKIQTMEKQAEEDLFLENRCVYGSKMSCAAFTRTMPALENGYPCCGSSDYFI